jgi:hypothetical protein
MAMPKFSDPGLEASLNITTGRVSWLPKARKLAAPNSPSEDMATNAAAVAAGLLSKGSST